MLKIFHFTNFIVKPTTSLKFKGLNKGLKNILAYVRHGPGGGTKGQNFVFDFLQLWPF